MTVKASPTVLKAAIDLGIDLEKITGSGKNGFITKKDLTDYNAANNVDVAKVTLTISENSKKLIELIDDKDLTNSIINAWETCRQVRVHVGELSKGYKQRAQDVTPAHIRHCIGIWSKHHDDYSDITNWGDIAKSTTFGETRLEARLTIIAGGFSDKPIQQRGLGAEMSRWFRSEILGEEVEAPKKRGRPAKPVDPNAPVKEKRPRGRPRKNAIGDEGSGNLHPYLALRNAREAKAEGETIYASDDVELSSNISDDVELSSNMTEEVKDEVIPEALID